jgi:tetratricopeptide (TPR) repeat protein
MQLLPSRMKSALITENEHTASIEFIFVKGGVHMMFQHVFAEMNDMLDEISQHYPMAHGMQKQTLHQKWNLLKHMSDGIIEEWLCFEEKMGELRQIWNNPDEVFDFEHPDHMLNNDHFIKGQGYYKLLMYNQALEQFQQVIIQHPEGNFLAVTYLAMCYHHLQLIDKAVEQFHLALKVTVNLRLQAIIYNALGCIEGNRGAGGKAREYFKKSHHSDPSLPEPVANLEACLNDSGQLQFGKQLTSLL